MSSQSQPSPKNYKCPICSKGLTSHHNLRVHINKHVGVRPYVCKVHGCAETFSQQANLKRHAKNRHDIKCPECGEVLASRGDVPTHYKAKHPGVPFKNERNRNFKCDCGHAVSSCPELLHHYAECATIARNREIIDEYKQSSDGNNSSSGSSSSSGGGPEKVQQATDSPQAKLGSLFPDFDSLSLDFARIDLANDDECLFYHTLAQWDFDDARSPRS